MHSWCCQASKVPQRKPHSNRVVFSHKWNPTEGRTQGHTQRPCSDCCSTHTYNGWFWSSSLDPRRKRMSPYGSWKCWDFEGPSLSYSSNQVSSSAKPNLPRRLACKCLGRPPLTAQKESRSVASSFSLENIIVIFHRFYLYRKSYWGIFRSSNFAFKNLKCFWIILNWHILRARLILNLMTPVGFCLFTLHILSSFGKIFFQCSLKIKLALPAWIKMLFFDIGNAWL